MIRIDEVVRATLQDHAEAAPAAAPVVNRVLADRARRRRRGWAVAGAVAAAAATVVAVGVAVTNDPDSSPGPSTTTVMSDDDRTVTIYSVVLARFLRDSFRGEDRIPETVLVAIRPAEGAGWTVTHPEIGEPIPPDVRADITGALAPLTDIKWVKRLPGTSFRGSPGDTTRPAITLGLLPDGDEVNVSISAYLVSNEGWLQTYVLAHDNGGWRITGTDAPSGLT